MTGGLVDPGSFGSLVEKVEAREQEARRAGAIKGREGVPSACKGTQVAWDVRVVGIVEVVGSKRCRRVSIGCVEEVDKIRTGMTRTN